MYMVPQAYVTHRNDIGGRLGDKFITAVKALWLAHKYNLHYLYNPSDYYKLFKIHEEQSASCPYQPTNIDNENKISKNASAFYHIDYFFKCNNWPHYADLFAWDDLVCDTAFMGKIRDCFVVPSFVPRLEIPSDRLSVAVHVRKGSGGDLTLVADPKASRDRIRDVVTIRMPRDQFYVEQIAKLSELYGNPPMYVFIFTDHKDPQKIMMRYQAKINKANIQFDCRRKGNSHCNDFAVEDMCEMTRFDCLIRSMSNLGQMAHALGNYRCVIYPTHSVKVNGKIVVDRVRIMKND